MDQHSQPCLLGYHNRPPDEAGELVVRCSTITLYLPAYDRHISITACGIDAADATGPFPFSGELYGCPVTVHQVVKAGQPINSYPVVVDHPMTEEQVDNLVHGHYLPPPRPRLRLVGT